MGASSEELLFSQWVTRTILQLKHTFLFVLMSVNSLAVHLPWNFLSLLCFWRSFESQICLYFGNNQYWDGSQRAQLYSYRDGTVMVTLPCRSGSGCLLPSCLYFGNFMVLITEREARWLHNSPGRNLKQCSLGHVLKEGLPLTPGKAETSVHGGRLARGEEKVL